MDLQLQNKTALVTGSTVGIGFAIASQLAAENAHVILNGRTPARLKEAQVRLQSLHPHAKISAVAADVSTVQGCSILTAAAPDIDILINNAGIFEPKPFADISDEDWLRFFQTNVLSGVRLSRFYLPKLIAKNWGRIIFISSESALQTPAEMIHYGLTKTAQLALSRGLAETTINTQVTVNSILPGPTASEGVQTFVSDLAKAHQLSPEEFEKQFFKTARPTSLLQRFATPEEVASLVAYVASPLASATNGSALRVDGGTYRSIT